MVNEIKKALIFSFLFNFIMVMSNFQERTFDSYTHMFFADHYRRAWFSLWEYKWYGGFYVNTYPPMAHQVLALFSILIGDLELSYQLLTLLLLLLLPVGMYSFSKIFIGENNAKFVPIIAIFLPSILTTIYIFGQFTSLFSLVFLLLSTYFFERYTSSTGNRLTRYVYFLLTLLSLSISITSHQFTSVFFTPIFLITILLKYILDKNIELAKKLIIIALFAYIISLIVLLPYIMVTLSNALSGQTMKPIPHGSRDIFANLRTFVSFFALMYGPLVLWIPLSLVYIVKSRRGDLVVLTAIALLLFVLGLGGTTPLPSILFGKYWELLTYDRFSLWATVMFVPLIAFSVSRRIVLFNILVVLLLLFTGVIVNLSFKADQLYLPRKVNLDPIVEFLNSDDNWKWRYITLDFGGAQLAKLSILTKAPTLDGFYVWARQDPLLRDSGIETIDGAKYWENGLEVLNKILANASRYKIKYVICNDPFYYDILKRNNFTLLFSQENTRDGRLGGVTIWVNTAPIPQLSHEELGYEENMTYMNYLWGSTIIIFIIFLVILFLRALFVSKKYLSSLLNTNIFD